MPRARRRRAYRDGRATRVLATALAVLAWASAADVVAHASVPITTPPAVPPRPAPAALPPTAAATVEHRTLDGGVRLVLERRPGAPRVAIELLWPGGLAAEPAARAGGTAILAAAIDATCRLAAQGDAGTLTARAGRTHLAVRGAWPAGAWREGLRTARACPRSAAVADALVAARDRAAHDQLRLRGSPLHRAAALVARARWGDHALGLAPHRAGGTAAMSASALRAHQAAQLATAPIVVVVGDVTLDELALELADPTVTGGSSSADLRALQAPAAPRLTPALPALPALPAVRQHFATVAGPGAAIAVALGGLPPTDADRAALEVLAAILADPSGPLAAAHAGGTLTVALLDAQDHGGLVVALAGAPPLAPRLTALEVAVTGLAATGPGALDVDRARAQLVAAQQRPELRATTLARAALAGAPDPRGALPTVDTTAVARVAATVLRWDQAVLATVQPADVTPAVDRLMARPARRPQPARRPPRHHRRSAR